ncbi:MAG: histidine phosphatase family protein [Myxococcota bacterium]
MEIVFIRHAQSVANVTGHWQGQGDAPLSEQGRAQARALAERLGDEPFDLVVASDLSRAADTARALDRELELDPSWREVDVGAWEGLTRAEVVERFPDQIAALQRGEPIPIGGGESWTDLLHRVEGALARLRERLGDRGRALVVSHGGVIHILVSSLMGLHQRRPRPIGRVGNTALTRLRFEGEVCELGAFNDAGHLGPIGSWTAERLEAGDAVVTLVGTEGAAERLGVPLGGRAGGDVRAAIEATAARHPSQRMGLLCEGPQVARYAGTLFGHGRRHPARVGVPRPDASCDVVLSSRAATFAGYNLTR